METKGRDLRQLCVLGEMTASLSLGFLPVRWGSQLEVATLNDYRWVIRGLWILSDLRVITSPHFLMDGEGVQATMSIKPTASPRESLILSAQTLLHHNTVGLQPRLRGRVQLSLGGCGDP